MNIIKEADFRKQIKSEPAKGYLFFGDEDYMKTFALKAAVETISPDPAFSFFNVIELDSISYSPDALIDAMMPLPMMADRKIIILSGLDFVAMQSYELDELCEALGLLDEYDYNTLIIDTTSDRFYAGDFSRRQPKYSSTLAKLAEHLTPVHFDRNSPQKLAMWISRHFTHNGVTADASVCSLMVERCGRDMFNLVSETDKLSFYVLSSGRDTVTREDVMRVAIPAAEYDAFAFTNAISARRHEEALNVLADMKHRKLDPIMIMAEITSCACNMLSAALLAADGLTQSEIAKVMNIHEFRVSKILQNDPDVFLCRRMVTLCGEADTEIKSYNADGYAVLEKLICII